MGKSAGSEVTHWPMMAEINRCKVIESMGCSKFGESSSAVICGCRCTTAVVIILQNLQIYFKNNNVPFWTSVAILWYLQWPQVCIFAMDILVNILLDIAIWWRHHDIMRDTWYCWLFLFWPSGTVITCVCVSVCVRVYQSLACLHDNSSAVQARITKFGTEVQNTLVDIPISFGDDRPWPSSSNLTWKLNFTSFWVCLRDNVSPVSARITIFGPEMHLTTVKIPIDFGHDKPSASI